ncbi:MAG: SDR family NAD(P)-dependent oxidoreductase [Thermomicrobiales bacterium]
MVEPHRGMTTRRTVVITGAGHGIGQAIAAAFAATGAAVVIADRDHARAETVARALSMETGSPVLAVETDVRDSASVEAMVEAAVAAFGGIDVLVNNAGIYPSSLVVEMRDEEWDAVFDTNVKGMFLVSRAVARRMIERGAGGKIVNTSSGSAEAGRIGAAHYCASKAAVKMFTRVLALELAQYDIAVNAVGPGLIEVPGWSLRDDYIAAMVAANPMGRMGTPEDVARAVLYLASPEATYITGTTLYVDGGSLAGRHVPLSG